MTSSKPSKPCCHYVYRPSLGGVIELVLKHGVMSGSIMVWPAMIARALANQNSTTGVYLPTKQEQAIKPQQRQAL